MARLNTFKIQFHGCGSGEHEFQFDVDEAFFSHFADSEITHGQISVAVLMTKGLRQLQFNIHLEGEVELSCDRCLDTYQQSIDAEYMLYGKFGDGNSEEELDVVWIADNEHEIDLAGYIYEYVVLSLPLKRVHPDLPNGESGCDQDMLNRLSDIVITSDE